MDIVFQKSFQKDYAKQKTSTKRQTKERISLFLEDRFSPLLSYHALKGEFLGCYSLNASADVRVIFYVENNTMYLIRVGTHSQHYG